MENNTCHQHDQSPAAGDRGFGWKDWKDPCGSIEPENVGGLLDKVAGGCLIIEQAGDMEKKTVSELSGLLDADESGLFVILEDTSKGIKRLFAQNETFAKNSVNRFLFRFYE